MATDLKTTAQDITLTRFYGGRDRGVCVQITTGWQEHVSLTREQAHQLAQDLLEFSMGEETADFG